MTRLKGILFLLDVFQTMEQKNWELGIMGDGALLPGIKARVGNDRRFKIYGWLEGEDRDRIIQESDFIMAPSICYENLPTIIALGFKYDRPTIASDIGGMKEAIKEGINGYLFKAGDKEDLKRVLKKILI